MSGERPVQLTYFWWLAIAIAVYQVVFGAWDLLTTTLYVASSEWQEQCQQRGADFCRSSSHWMQGMAYSKAGLAIVVWGIGLPLIAWLIAIRRRIWARYLLIAFTLTALFGIAVWGAYALGWAVFDEYGYRVTGGLRQPGSVMLLAAVFLAFTSESTAWLSRADVGHDPA